MCIAMPAQVLAVDGTGATVDWAGRRMRAATLIVPDVEVGEWVLVAAGAIIQRLAPAEAIQIRAALLATRLANAGDQEGDPSADS
jgi:hydrogenase expression/formation protein HypC